MSKRTFAIARAVAAIGGTAAIVSGVTFAALTSNTVTLSNNTLASATAELKIWNGATYDVDAQGVTVTNLVPGTLSDAFPFYLQNNGGIDLDLAAISSTPASFFGFNDWADIKAVIKDHTGAVVADTDLGALIAGNVAVGTIPAGATGDGGSNVPGNYTIQFSIAPDQVDGNHVSVGNFTITFSGTQHIVVPT